MKPVFYKNIRSTIISQKEKYQEMGLEKQFNVMIKPTPKSNYKNTVDLLDEMIINDVKKYSLEDLDIIESKLIANK